jgi:predicted Zn-dependent protease with MMP-like domain
MQRKAFESLVDQAIRGLPSEFRDKLQNVEVVIEDWPSRELLQRMAIDEGDGLFGLYEGVPLTERGFSPPLYPDRIWIFQKSIEEACETDEDITEEIRVTLLHEVAHFFGIDDEHLDEIGYS